MKLTRDAALSTYVWAWALRRSRRVGHNGTHRFWARRPRTRSRRVWATNVCGWVRASEFRNAFGRRPERGCRSGRTVCFNIFRFAFTAAAAPARVGNSLVLRRVRRRRRPRARSTDSSQSGSQPRPRSRQVFPESHGYCEGVSRDRRRKSGADTRNGPADWAPWRGELVEGRM
jgi:hypothetical protein